MVTFAGVSLPRASGSVARATASVIRSPMTTTRAILVITSSPGHRFYYRSGQRARAASGRSRHQGRMSV
jgi:hypothetical protein